MNVLDCIGLKKHFVLGGAVARLPGFGARPASRQKLHAVDEVDFAIGDGESVGLVGESGCGKSTLVRLITRMLDPSAGEIRYREQDIGAVPARGFAGSRFRARIQMVFQDPSDSLNPRQTAFAAIAEPLRRLADLRDAAALALKVNEAATRVGLPLELLARFPHQLSGGQKARVGIARAIITQPDLLVLDEPTAALDVSVQATILRLLAQLKRDLGMSYLFVSHDLNVVRLLCDRVIVMYLGRIVECGPAQAVFAAPRHPYTRALVSAIPGGRPGERVQLPGEPRSPIDPAPEVCRFFGRCPKGADRCQREMPLLDAGPHAVACHFPER
ncbi:MAG TPA: ABC transporter ATP-binding protein [Burkholderiales bacterium]|nr:ABC transporter ATP-binding protein [Burkholderiales bacterium]